MADLERALREQVPAILQALAGTSIEELRLERNGASVSVRRSAGELVAAAHVEPPATHPAAAELNKLATAGRVEVRAQVVGLFHRARETDGPALASEGERVDGGKVIGVIETLGIASDVAAPVAGRLAELIAHDGQAVEYGALLAVIVPE